MSNAQIILGLETSTHACSIVLLVHGQYYHKLNIEPKKHSDLILPMIQSVLAEANIQINDITAIAVGVGPGSFTGVRVAVGLAKAFGFALKVPVWPISSLRALANQVYRKELCASADIVLSTWDARMKAVYWGLYQFDNQTIMAVQNLPDQLSAPEALDLSNLLWDTQDNSQDNSPDKQSQNSKALDAKQLVTVGCGVSHYYDAMMGAISQYNPKVIEDFYPNAQDVIELAIQDKAAGLQPADVFELAPEYVRNDVAQVPKNMIKT